MTYRFLADAVVLLHAAFVAFVVLGGFLAWRRRSLVWAHLPCAVWGVLLEYRGWICPLTPLENDLRRRAGLQVWPVVRRGEAELVAQIRQALGASFDEKYAAGGRLSRREAVAAVRDRSGASGPA